jgi:hypothetical protein
MIHAPQHFLYFLPLPHVHGSFLPILGVVFFIGANALVVRAVGLDFAEAWAAPFTRLGLSSRKHAHHPISWIVSATRRRWGLSASLARTRSLPIVKSRWTSSKPM